MVRISLLGLELSDRVAAFRSIITYNCGKVSIERF